MKNKEHKMLQEIFLKELDLKYKDIFRKRCIIFNNTPRIGELTTVEDVSYLEVLPSSMISDNLSQS